MTSRPVLGRAAPLAPPRPTVTRLSNGFRTKRFEVGSVPKVQARLVLRAGALNEASGQCWLSRLAGTLLKEGAGTLDSAALAAAFAAIGGQLEVDAGEDVTTLRAQALSEFAPDLIHLLASVVRDRTLPESELPRLKADLLRERAVIGAQPNVVALATFRAALYRDHPYGRVLPAEEDIDGFTIAGIRSYLTSNVGAARSTLYVAGPVDAAAVDAAIVEAFGDWEAGLPPLLLPPNPHSERGVHLVDRPQAEQSTIYLGLPVPDPSQPDYVPLMVLNALVGGAFMSRITLNIRESKGYTYSPRSELSVRYRDGYWAEAADVTTSVTGAALSEIFREVARVREEIVPDAELEGMKNYVAGSVILRNATGGGLIDQEQFVDLHELGDAYVSSLLGRLYAVDAAEVRRLAVTYLRPESMTIAVAGDAALVEEQLAPFGPISRA